jgi:polyhydroxybutyrate depolymerase
VRWLLVSGLLLVPLVPAATPPRPCAFSGIRRGDVLGCVGTERTVLDRPFCVHPPSVQRPKLPVVVLLHGYSSNANAQSRYFDLDSHVDRRGFILVKPNGTLNAHGSRYWNSGRHLSAGGPDDVDYLTAVIEDVVKAFDADPSRVFLVGHSNGAFMANRYACERSDRVAAIASLAGSVDPGACRPARPVSVLVAHGTADRIVRYGGGSLPLSTATYGSAEATVGTWARADGCGTTRKPGKPVQLVCDASESSVSAYAGCPAGIAVELWQLDGVGHVPNFALPAWPDAVLDFLYAHPKPGRAP